MVLLTVRICRVVIKESASGSVEAAHNHKVTLVLWLSAETLLAYMQKAAVFDRRGAQFARQDHGVDQHYGNVALFQMRLDFLNCYRTAKTEQTHIADLIFT